MVFSVAVPVERPRDGVLDRAWARALIILAATLAIYGAAIGFEFLHWDDDVLVADNVRLRAPSPSTLLAFWREEYAGLYMPLTYSFWMIEGVLSSPFAPLGDSFAPWVFHLGNVLLFAAAAYQVNRLLVRITRSSVGALLGTLLFIVHPVQVESVAWVSETKGLLAALFGFTALVAYVDAARSSHRSAAIGHYALATLALILAHLAKPSAVAIPLMATIIDFFFLSRPRWTSIGLLAPWYFGAGVAIAWTFQVQGEYIPMGAKPLDRAWMALDAYVFYLRQLVFAGPLGPDYGRDAVIVLSEGIGSLFGWRTLVAVLVLFLPLLTRPREILAAHLLFLTGLLPMLGFIPFGFQAISTVADRYMLLAMLGPALGWAFLTASWNPFFRLASLAIPGALAMAAYVQVGHWKNDAALIEQALRVNPDSPTFLTNRAVLRLREENLTGAIEDARRAIASRPRTMAAYPNLAAALYRSGDGKGAIDTLKAALELNPEDASSLTLVAALLSREGRQAEAVAFARQLVAMHPDSDVFRLRLGTYLILNNEEAEGLNEFRKTLDKPLTPPDDRLLVAQVHEQAGLSRDALKRYQAILDEFGHVPGAKLRIAWILATDPDPAIRDPAQSIRLCMQLTRGIPDGPAEVLDTLAAAQAALGKFDQAALTAERAAERARVKLKGRLAGEIDARRALYEQRRPYLRPPVNLLGSPRDPESDSADRVY